MASASSSSSSSAIEEIKAGLVQLQELEEKLSNAGWQPNVLANATASSSTATKTAASTSPTSVAAAAAENDADAVLQRYIAARDLYLQRRLQAKFVEHIQTFDPRQETFDMPCVPNEDEDDDIAQRHAAALTNLETTVQMIHSQASQLRDGYQANKSNREELQRMLQDMEEEDDDKDDSQNDGGDEEEVNDIDLENEQERIEELQKTKRQLEEELASLQQKATEVQERTRHKHNEIALLERQIEGDNDDGIDGGIQNEESMRKKIEQLREMKAFYDSMRGVLEELGGVKIDAVEEIPANRHLRLILVLYDEYKVEVELEVYRQRFLKLVDAKWTMTGGGSSSSSNEPATPMIGGGGSDSDGFSLKVEPLHDLVQVAKTTLGPPHDLRFVVREALARLRIQKDRYQDLSILRQNVLTKIEDGGNQVVCSLNDGIVIVMRLYEHWVRVEQIVGVGGWDTGTTKRIQDAIKVDENSTPTSIVSQVQDEIENLQNSGFVKPGTPKLPQKVFGEGDGGGDS